MYAKIPTNRIIAIEICYDDDGVDCGFNVAFDDGNDIENVQCTKITFNNDNGEPMLVIK